MSDEPEIYFIDDLARRLRCSRSTIEARRREHGTLPPEMPAIDKRPRWYRPTVDAWMARTKASEQWRVAAAARAMGATSRSRENR